MRRLERFGNILTWVMGAWQEGSKDLHDLLDLLAEVAVLGLARGCEATEIERAQVLLGYPVNNSSKSQFRLSFGQACQSGRGPQGGGKEEGMGAEGGTEASGGEESSLASPRPGHKGFNAVL